MQDLDLGDIQLHWESIPKGSCITLRQWNRTSILRATEFINNLILSAVRDMRAKFGTELTRC